MIEIACQERNGAVHPFGKEDAEALKNFKPNQILRAKISGIRKERSVTQLRLFFACCRTVVDNNSDPSWDNTDRVLNQLKVKLEFVDLNKSIVDAKGIFHPHYRSISFANLKHMDACNFFDRAFVILAKKIGVTVDDLLSNAELHG